MHGEVTPISDRLSKDLIQQELDILKSEYQVLVRVSNTPKSAHPTKADLKKWVAAMSSEAEESGGMVAPDNTKLPAAYTYFGQLVAHDITSHRALGIAKPSLRLQTLYGLGPSMSPQYYEHYPDSDSKYTYRGIKFVLDSYTHKKGNKTETVYDMRRIGRDGSGPAPQNGRQSGVPLMADARNDQNFILSQLLVQLKRLHNLRAEYHFSTAQTPGEVFRAAADDLIEMYQRVLLTDYLPRILYGGTRLLTDLIDHGNFRIYEAVGRPCVLSELFARAALRYGHSQVRQLYQTDTRGGLVQLYGFDFDLRGFVRDSRRKLDWICLLAENNGRAFQPAKAFDTSIVMTLDNLPFFPEGKNSLLTRNLRNSFENFSVSDNYRNQLYTEIEAQTGPLPELDELKQALETPGKWNLDGNVPLWVFLLAEAQYLGKGETLGPVGSRIIAEQIIWALRDDPASVLAGLKKYEKLKPLSLRELLEKVTGSMQPEEDFLRATSPKRIQPGHQRTLSAPTILNESTFSEIDHALAVRNREIYAGTEPGLDMSSTTTAANVTEIEPGTPGKALRTTILSNGFYKYPPTGSDSSLKKKEIRVYISKKMILRHCPTLLGHVQLTALQEVTGLFFILALKTTNGQKNLFLLARRTGETGALPNGVPDVWISSDPLVNAPSSELALPFTQNFANDGYDTMKENGLSAQTLNLYSLLTLLGYDPADNDVRAYQNVDATVKLVSVPGQYIADGEGFELDENYFPEDAQSANSPFFALKIETTDGNNVLTATAPGRPYPPYCYASNIAWS